ncbi:MAG: hypothetical protein A2X67_07295 [Ignavibacteria bacterium GWA2_55_11]|nr:MAG: hypothetical protein A2X67_07295 [Ignavibacteria bacterium GWA2_55_11]OGU43664.1 MAG: hypothetical protein A2X68_06530 [Ignavibacteria bacterium GWC2_56_12]OGU63877.1 MAG: hypothetical protein A3C56_06085 [Ignavibacteria bacterium RIFCSPHIGHO2_02_FULL_56_12]OGU69052.1 MAG: hypothetical protein A3H45_04080 [Ignavibacteria bacterium RIFCSPLOWO2_02_FULL_55_14]OGU76432.1 MAG: hypothetical protein A3G43_00300 [Ignavibacteria bacterium RIFCSPLOWO2_12_FULL_56_21]
MAIGAYRSVLDAPFGSDRMDALAVVFRLGGMALCTRFGYVDFTDGRAGFRRPHHLVTAVAIHTVCRLAVAVLQRRAVNARPVRGDKPRARGHSCPHVGIVKVARKAESLLRQLRGGAVLRTQYDLAPVTLGACRRPFDIGGQRLPMGGQR